MSETEPNRKRKSQNKKYWQAKGKQGRRQGDLQSGLRGVLITCNGKEKESVRDAYNILNQFREKLMSSSSKKVDSEEKEEAAKAKATARSPRAAAEEDDRKKISEVGDEVDPKTKEDKKDSENENDEDDEVDPLEAVKRECAVIKENKNNHVFQQYRTNVSNCMFIGCRDGTMDLRVLVESIFAKSLETQTQYSRFIQRFIPVQRTCRAYTDDLRKLLSSDLVPAALAALPEVVAGSEDVKKTVTRDTRREPKWELQFRITCSTTMEKQDAHAVLEEVMSALAPMSRNAYRDPDLVFFVYIIKAVACVGYATNFDRFKKYNLEQIVK